ncbi:MAG: hypothetical protein RIS47_879 [Bacteroidota bacterium]
MLIEQLETSNATVSIDAMGCQSDIADQIAKKEGRYLLSFKMNQPNTYDLVDKMFKIKQVHSESDTENMHGKRYEFRECSVINLTV